VSPGRRPSGGARSLYGRSSSRRRGLSTHPPRPSMAALGRRTGPAQDGGAGERAQRCFWRRVHEMGYSRRTLVSGIVNLLQLLSRCRAVPTPSRTVVSPGRTDGTALRQGRTSTRGPWPGDRPGRTLTTGAGNRGVRGVAGPRRILGPVTEPHALRRRAGPIAIMRVDIGWECNLRRPRDDKLPHARRRLRRDVGRSARACVVSSGRTTKGVT
jgi:hypothetical protein